MGGRADLEWMDGEICQKDSHPLACRMGGMVRDGRIGMDGRGDDQLGNGGWLVGLSGIEGWPGVDGLRGSGSADG